MLYLPSLVLLLCLRLLLSSLSAAAGALVAAFSNLPNSQIYCSLELETWRAGAVAIAGQVCEAVTVYVSEFWIGGGAEMIRVFFFYLVAAAALDCGPHILI